MSDSEGNLELFFQSKLEEGEKLLEKLRLHFSSLDGIVKLERKIRAEIKFLHKLKESPNPVKKEHILSSNLRSLSSILQILENCEDPVAVLKPFKVDNGCVSRIEVDVVSDGGAVWQKAIARKPEALYDIFKGKTSCAQKSVVDHARIYLECANLHPHFFIPPKVVFHFKQGVSRTLAEKLIKQGISVEGEVQEIESDTDTSDYEDSSTDCDEASTLTIETSSPSFEYPISNDKVFLDITSMVAYVSSMTSGGASFIFPKPIYNQQAEWERNSPAKPKLDELFEGKQLVTCSLAFQDFKGLVDKMGGPGEKERTNALLSRLQVVADEPSQRVANMQITANIKKRSKVIFGTADRLGIAIVTANTGFVRSAFGQGVEIAFHPHEPRVLTEQQEAFSQRLE
uniref:EOG090X0CWG n=1 Tax=Moina brachiata TaxID=675436 RepID=A0A4Y7NKV7_9CRUS|nr:EOG090X0CWG [Moina brachiata]SVE93246.1 EOG090X0CWG [Moina brachiata]